MPAYTFENINTNEETIVEMKIIELDEYKKQHPELIQIFSTATPLVDPVLLGVTRPPQDFTKEVLGRIKRSNPGSTIGSARWS